MDGMPAAPSLPTAALAALPSGDALPVRWSGLDRVVHAAQGRLTSGLSPVGLPLAFLDWAGHLAASPCRCADLAGAAVIQQRRLARAAFGQRAVAPPPADHRFSDPAWRVPALDLLVQSFLLAEQWWDAAANAPDGVAPASQRIAAFTLRQLVDMASPSNVPWLNPEVIQATLATGGRNLQGGFHNLLTDWQEALTGRPAGSELVVGRDLAATPGKVVLCNGLIELVQYAPTTARVRREPVLIVPAWIMKYYILDLSAQNSLISWLVGQGHTAFAISWRNPGPEMRDTSLNDYRTRGVMAALDTIGAICPGAKVQATGYRLGGTLLTIAAAAMARDGDDRLAGVTLFCAQTDFTEAGELQLFITEDQIAFLSDVMAVQGYLDSRQMAGAFQLLRSNDLIWSRPIRSYLLGQREHPNDLMAWNAGGTRMPARMHAEYLHRLFLMAEGRFPACGRPVSVGDIGVPLFAVGTETDHIAPWRSVHKLHLLNGGDLTFVLTSGGHNAGVVSEPGHPHRHYRIRHRAPGGHYLAPDEWVKAAALREGSWWPAWAEWLGQHSGGMVKPPLGGPGHAPIADAPGTYAHEH